MTLSRLKTAGHSAYSSLDFPENTSSNYWKSTPDQRVVVLTSCNLRRSPRIKRCGSMC